MVEVPVLSKRTVPPLGTKVPLLVKLPLRVIVSGALKYPLLMVMVPSTSTLMGEASSKVKLPVTVVPVRVVSCKL